MRTIFRGQRQTFETKTEDNFQSPKITYNTITYTQCK